MNIEIGDRKLKAASYICLEILKLALLLLSIDFLFFNNFLGLVILAPYAVYSIIGITKKFRCRENEIIRLEFRDMLRCIQASMEAGASIEKAIYEIEEDLVTMHGSKSIIVMELKKIQRRLELGKTIESVLTELSNAYEVREITNFVSIMTQTKRSGGNILKLIRASCEDMYEKEETRRQIDEILSANRTECMIMKLMPLIIIMYFRIFSSSFISILYDTSMGRMIMIVLAFVYIVLLEVSEKIVRRVED